MIWKENISKKQTVTKRLDKVCISYGHQKGLVMNEIIVLCEAMECNPKKGKMSNPHGGIWSLKAYRFKNARYLYSFLSGKPFAGKKDAQRLLDYKIDMRPPDGEPRKRGQSYFAILSRKQAIEIVRWALSNKQSTLRKHGFPVNTPVYEWRLGKPAVRVKVVTKNMIIRLNVDGKPPIYNTSWYQVAYAISRLRPLTSSAFAILERSDGDFLQAYGCGAEYAVEWHRSERSTGRESLCVAGVVPIGADTIFIGTLRRHIAVLKGEVLVRRQVYELFRAFFDRKSMPEGYVWRDFWPQVEKLKKNVKRCREAM